VRLRVAPGDHQAALLWAPPVRKGGAAVVDYLVEYRVSTETAWTPLVRATSTATTAIVVGLLDDRRYVFRVSARNAAGTGAPSAVSRAITPHG
jgi:hypothetical protein